jgi:uncharacterized membrane protein
LSSVLSGLVALATAAYPFAVYFGLGTLEPHWIAAALAALMLARAWATRQAFWIAAGACTVLLGLASLQGGASLPLKLYPVLVNATLLAVFATSLARPPSAVERIARMTQPDLPPHGVAFTRTVTWVWCVFFAVNGAVALATALWASTAVWTLYNGFVAYLLMAALMGGEWLVRRKVLQTVAHG